MIQDLRENTGRPSLRAVWADIACHPYEYEYVVRRWNWKSAITSAILRGGIFFSTNLAAGRAAAVAALPTDLSYRVVLSGVVGSTTQALRICEAAWAAALTASVALPVLAHLVEITVHFLRGTPRLATSVGVSIGFTIVSTLFNLYVMRHGVLVVGKDSKPLTEDLAAILRLIGGFLAVLPLAVRRTFRKVA